MILADRIETTITKCKAIRPLVERMITLGKRGDLHSRRQAGAYLLTAEALDRLFTTVGPRYATRNGGYSRIVRLGPRKGDAAEVAYIELLGSEEELNARAAKRAERRAKRQEDLRRQFEEAEGSQGEGGQPEDTSDQK